jgi:hypothetical protein
MSETYTTSFNQRLTNIHDAGTCLKEYCSIHNWSDHPLKNAPQKWREDKGLMERICKHGVGHPDPDEIGLEYGGRGVHGCDGCCVEAVELDNELE